MKRAALLGLALLAACSSNKGGYYKDDGPGARAPGDLAAVPDARPRVEPLNKFANKPYEVFGKKYVPLASLQAYKQRGVASWYGKRFHGQKTASGETYDMYAMTAAHPILPIPSYARVTSVKNGRQVIVRINDRGPFHGGRVIDLSYAAAYRLGLIDSGSGEVEIQSIVPGARAHLDDAAGETAETL
jgi:rare lipoprotein A